MLNLLKPARVRSVPVWFDALRLPLLLILAFALVCESAWVVVLAPREDVNRYQCYAVAFWQGGQGLRELPAGLCAFLGAAAAQQPAFHVTPLEYPPLALLPFSAPLIAPTPYYAFLFTFMIMLLVGLVAWLLYTFRSRTVMLRYLFLMVVGAWALFQLRYDLFPAACMLGCLIAADRRRWGLAYIALACATLLKVYPVAALPVLFIAEWQDRAERMAGEPRAQREPGAHALDAWWGGLAIFGAIILGAQAALALMGAPGALLQPIAFLVQRPLQIESMQSTIAWVAHLGGAPLRVVSSYGSLNVVSPLADGAGWASACLCVAGWLYVCWLQWRRRLSLGQAMIALLCIIMVTGKVFSPQYLLWLIPLLAYVGASQLWMSWWLGVCTLTMGIYVVYFIQMGDVASAARILPTLPGYFEVVAARNIAFLLMTLAYLFNWRQARHDHSLKEAPPI